jgi:hypothetical protein
VNRNIGGRAFRNRTSGKRSVHWYVTSPDAEPSPNAGGDGGDQRDNPNPAREDLRSDDDVKMKEVKENGFSFGGGDPADLSHPLTCNCWRTDCEICNPPEAVE